jgi:hypothetical protein
MQVMPSSFRVRVVLFWLVCMLLIWVAPGRTGHINVNVPGPRHGSYQLRSFGGCWLAAPIETVHPDPGAGVPWGNGRLRFHASAYWWLGISVILTALCWRFHRLDALTLGRSRQQRGQCPTCGYDLKGEHAAGCPECGWNRAEARG